MPAGVVRPIPHRAVAPLRRALARVAVVAGLVGLACVVGACSPLVRDAPFGGARDHVADVALTGPFNGQIVDGTTSAPIGDATVVAVWSYDRGDGLVGPAGSETYVARSDRAGRYRVPLAPSKLRGQSLRLVDFTLFVYKRGYVAYRSDVPYDGGRRAEFVARHNRVALRKWASTDSHAEHLLMLSPPPEIERLTHWERLAANAALLRAVSGAPSEPGAQTTPSTLEWLDATALLPPEEVRRRTGYLEAFNVGEFADLARTHFYHGVHLRAVDREEDTREGVTPHGPWAGSTPSSPVVGVRGQGSLPTHPGSSTARLVLVARDGSEGDKFAVVGDRLTLGRRAADVLFPEDDFLSPTHARLERSGDHYWLVDAGSQNGVFLRVRGTSPIYPGDSFMIGHQLMRVENVEGPTDEQPPDELGTRLFGTPLQPAWGKLVVLGRGGIRGDQFGLRGARVVLGRELGDVVFPHDPFLSREHARLRLELNGATMSVFIEDLNSANGTYIRIRGAAELHNRDTFRIGDQIIRLRLD